jgi:hypothetical protein
MPNSKRPRPGQPEDDDMTAITAHAEVIAGLADAGT